MEAVPAVKTVQISKEEHMEYHKMFLAGNIDYDFMKKRK